MSAKVDPKDKTFLITGGASGLGAVYTEWFLKEGAKSIAILDILVEQGQELTAKLNALYPGNVVFYECDVGDEAKLSDVFNRVIENFGQLDAIVNNAGMMNDSPDGWKKSTDVTWVRSRGLVSLTLKGVKHMRTDEGGAGGTIINISSTGALVRTPFLPIYSGNKAAVLHFGQCISMDPFYGNTGVRLLTFCLGPTETPLLENLADRTWDEKNKKILVDYVATETFKQKPEFAADAIVKIFKEGENGSIWLTTLNKPTRDITSNYRAAFKTRGLVSLTLKGVKHMRTDEGGAGGTIINISSTGALVRTPFVPIYSGNKAAVLHFGQCISMDPFYGNTGVRLLTFCLGPTETPLLENLADRTWDEKNKKILVDYVATETVMQTPEFAADAIVKIFKEGENGSIWLTTLNKPTRDITSKYRAAFETVEDLARS